MKTHIIRMAAIVALVTGGAAGPLLAGGAVNSVLLQAGDISCQHVIDMLMLYGNANDDRLVVPLGNSLILGGSVGDLELISVTMVDTGNDAVGPTIAITLQNNSQRIVGDFSISAVAVLGRIHPFSPSTTATVKKVCAGETLEVQLQLPLESLAMGRAGSEILAFRKLVVVIDSFDELLERSESNNILILDRTQIPVAAVVEETIQAVPGVTDVADPEATNPAAPAEVAPRENLASPSDSVEVAPRDTTVSPSPTKIDDIDFDKLEVIKK